jgi:small-conductance mechanosensitive channel
VVIAGYLCLEYLLLLFPHTRPFGERLGLRFVHLLASLGEGVMHALPDLGIVFVVWVLAKFANTAARRFFSAVARGTLHSRFFDATTAPISQRLCTVFIWITAVIVAFPYIPGSDTPAFRGISVLAGLMISLGSSSLISQFVGGLVVVYNRSCRVGDYVRVGEHEGTLSSIGLSSSRLVTPRNEEIVVPNSQLSNGTLINFSRLNETAGVALPVKVSIGYGTPWRQVQALLREAARRTAGLKSQPEPIVLQTLLGDFYVEYTLNVLLENPPDRVRVLSELHGHIQDVFNEHGVQIMSPHYRADPPAPVVVPREKWHLPPAEPPA